MKINRLKIKANIRRTCGAILIVLCACVGTWAQNFVQSLKVGGKTSISIVNRSGKISVKAVMNEEVSNDEKRENNVEIKAVGALEKDLKIEKGKNSLRIEVVPNNGGKRIDVALELSFAARVFIETADGEAGVSGVFEEVSAQTSTGTIYADVPTESLKYDFIWTQSRPRFLSSMKLEDVKESAGGRFSLSGKIEPEKNAESEDENTSEVSETTPEETKDKEEDKKKKKKKKRQPKPVKLNFTTARGVILLGVPPSRAPSDLRERPLTEAAKAIARSGDSVLSEAVRRVSPKYFGDYAQTLPVRRRAPNLSLKDKTSKSFTLNEYKRLLINVTDKNGRAVNDLKAADFTVSNGAEKAEIVNLATTGAPFNLVILLDVSASVEEKIDFIRKAARNFVNVSDKRDRLSIVTFREDAQKIVAFSTDKNMLSKSLDTFDAGGGTALYDALGYVLTDTIKPLRGERTAIVILSDGDDNRSFLTFDALQGAIKESGALIYPLYVPSELIPFDGANDAETAVDPLRSRYLGLTTKADAEGKRLAELSGGVYYPIKSLDEIQKSYEDVVKQLRASYSLTIRAKNLPTNAPETALPRWQVRVARPDAFVRIARVSDAEIVQSELREDQKEGAFFTYEAADTLKNVSEITGEIDKVVYYPRMNDTLSAVKLSELNINIVPPSFIVTDGAEKIGISKWVSPKRTRTYPYQRVYETLSQAKKAAVIPVLKDEGAKGERDFIQWDTISLMSLLDIYVVLTYYETADRAFEKDKITNQSLSNAEVTAKIAEIGNFRGTALEWNLKQLESIGATLAKAQNAYTQISQKTGVSMHSERGLNTFLNKIKAETNAFRELSRQKSQQAQKREFVTIQPNESLDSDTKGRVTITDKFGGQYFFTCDETDFAGETLYLIEDKHSRRSKMPAESEIKDGLLKMMLYANLHNVKLGGKSVKSIPVLRLTSEKITGKISSESDKTELDKFVNLNRFSGIQRQIVSMLFAEARENKFVVRIESVEKAKRDFVQTNDK